MDSDKLTPPDPAGNNNDASAGDTEISAGPKMYDFSSDFNISPIKDEPGADAPPFKPTPAVPATPAPIAPIAKPVVQTPPRQNIAVPAPEATTPVPVVTTKLETGLPGAPILPRGRTDAVTAPSVAAPKSPFVSAYTPKAPQTPVPPSPAPKPQSYREPIEQGGDWPFAFAKNAKGSPAVPQAAAPATPTTPTQTPTVSAPTPAVPMPAPQPIPAIKSAPGNAPVKTIRTEGGTIGQTTQAEQKGRPETDLQRDVLAILPNMKKSQAEAKAKAQVASVPPRPFASVPQSTDIKPLRTYETDVAEALARRKSSKASIAIAENKKVTGEERISNVSSDMQAAEATSDATTSKHSPFSLAKTLYILLSLILVGAGAYGGYYLYTVSPLFSVMQQSGGKPAQVQNTNKSLVPSDSRVTVSLDGADQTQVAQLVMAELAKQQTPGSVRDIYLTRTDTVTGVKGQIAPSDIAGIMDLGIPDVLARTIKTGWMLGVYTDQGGVNTLFVAAKTDFFQNAFAGMLQWEPSMADDLSPYLDPLAQNNVSGRFIDEIIKNKDVRTFIANDGRTLFTYSFLDNATLVMSQDTGALQEVIIRLENQAFVR